MKQSARKTAAMTQIVLSRRKIQLPETFQAPSSYLPPPPSSSHAMKRQRSDGSSHWPKGTRKALAGVVQVSEGCLACRPGHGGDVAGHRSVARDHDRGGDAKAFRRAVGHFGGVFWGLLGFIGCCT